ncbi:MAG: hypothetical protein JWM77_1804 [Rhodospirillales bacterium]|nr:hypothetical protein [Rhodospirillales bacterium]
MRPRSLMPPPHMNVQENMMLDLLSAGLVAVFVAAALAYVALCERI